MKQQLPGWEITKTIDMVFEEIVAAWQQRLGR
jgi:hypothetical protein